MAKLFISHASSDRALVSPLVDLLESGIGVEHGSIFCSSLKGQNIKPGTYFIETIRKEIEGADCILVLLTENFFASHFCLCELGAGWLLSKRLLPLAAPELESGLVKAVLEGMTVSSIQRSQDLDELRDILTKALGISGHGTPRWNEKRDHFLSKLPEFLGATEASGPVARPVHEKTLRELREYQDEYKRKLSEISALNKLIDELKVTKDRAEVAKVLMENSGAVEQFEQLTSSAKSAIEAIGENTRALYEALYYFVDGEDYSPESDDYADVRRLIEEGVLTESLNGRGYQPDTTNPSVRAATDALDALRSWLREAPGDFAEWYEGEWNSIPDILKRPFWRRHLW